MSQGIQIFPHPAVNRPVPPFHRETGLHNISVLKHIVGDQKPSRLQKPQHIRKEMNVLPFRRVHKNKIKASLKLFQYLRRVSLQKGDLGLPACSAEIFLCHRNPFFIFLNGRKSHVCRPVLTHQKRRKAYGCSYLQNRFRLFHCKQRFQKALHLLAYDRHAGLLRFFFYLI